MQVTTPEIYSWRVLFSPFYCTVPIVEYGHKLLQEVNEMRTAVCQHTRRVTPIIPYPNAMTRKEMAHKVLDLLLVAAIGAGCAASLLFLLVLI